MRPNPPESRTLSRRLDGWALASLIGIPVLAAVLLEPGLVTLHGDNLIQNYPLRILVGRILREGHLPLWDPYIWSGTPLLAGFNAGAAYPLTWIFALLSGPWAWTVTIAASYAVASTGFYTFLRTLGRSVWASWLGAVTFAFAGFMASQMVHLETLQGVGWLSWVAVALYQVSRSRTRRRRLGWTLGLGVFAGLVILVGSPEPMAYGAIFAAVLGLFFVADAPNKPAVLAGYGLAAVIGLMIGAAQWIPGEAFIHLSQRSHATFQFFSSMSVSPSDGVLLLFPYILGGYHRFLAMVYYSGPFNLPEVSSYVGLLPIFAAVRMFPRWAPGPVKRVLWMFYTLGLVGAVLALGKYTPVSHLLYHIPVLNGIRAQNRNLFMLDFALAAVFAFWVDHVRAVSQSQTREKAPLAIFVGIFLATLAIGLWKANRAVAAYMVPYLVITVLLGTGVAVLAAVLTKMPGRYRMLAVVLFTVVDLGLYDAGQYWLNVPNNSVATGTGYLAGTARRQIPPGTRFALYDPALDGYSQVDSLGQPDLNILTDLPSFQGYGSLVSSRYQQATAAHLQATFAPAVLSRPTVNQLNVSTLFTVPSSFISPVPASWQPKSSRTEAWGSARHPWFFGRTLEVQEIRVYLAAPLTGRLSGWRVGGIVAGSGQEKWYTPKMSVSGKTVTLSLPPVPLAGIAVQQTGRTPGLIGAAVSVAGSGKVYQLQGALQQQMAFPQWKFSGTVGEFGIFHNSARMGRFWLAQGKSAGTATVTRTTLQGQDTVLVDASRPTHLMRSEAYQPGWTATVSGPRKSWTVPVSAAGVIQEIAVPRGRYQVVFRYRPGSVMVGLEGSAVGVAAVLAAFAGLWAWKRRQP